MKMTNTVSLNEGAVVKDMVRDSLFAHSFTFTIHTGTGNKAIYSKNTG